MKSSSDSNIKFLQSKFPNTDIYFIGSGSDSSAYRVGDNVIRIPHNAQSAEMYVRELKICCEIAKYISVQIPNIIVHNDNKFIWVGHKMIVGHKWSWHKFMWHPTKQRNLGKSLAKFMAELHSINTKKLTVAIPYLSNSAPYMNFDDVAPFLSKYMNNKQMQFFRKKYENILSQPIDKSDLVLTHLGIKGPNSVVDENGNLSGVFDWCNAGIYERGRDMVLIRMLAPNALWRIFAREYTKLTGIKINQHHIDDLIKIEFLWSKRWISPDGEFREPGDKRLQKKNIGACMAHFHHLPMVCKWWWYHVGGGLFNH